ncbi:hypothetical protein FISHEDRAFT_78811 [Fistulina hepatica ATCC 64428]|uniref:Uncharacterized protein n=1 Tax=Fistulina hepatica ATCC 64428 TaxID=1128425 RepID=A0A0D7A012_9AGAR|nr:hypothetical protein FISHEDRAFT_78811 [Fistulina hepatica ATCC 64428]
MSATVGSNDLEQQRLRKSIVAFLGHAQALRKLILVLVVFCTASLLLYSSGFVTKSALVVSQNLWSTFGSSPNECPAHCPADPFVKSGMIHWGKYANDTQWIPFPDRRMDALTDSLRLEDVEITGYIPQEALSIACPMYTKALSLGDTSLLDFAKDRLVLIIGGVCSVPTLNMTIVHWFFFGMNDNDDYFSWFSVGKPLTFEARMGRDMLTRMERAGLGLPRRPDLIVMTSLFWDEKFLNAFHDHFNHTSSTYGFTYNELAWHRQRVAKLVSRIRELYGQDVPLMFRTRQIRQQTNDFKLLKIFQFDQGLRALAKQLNIGLWTWGGKLEGYTVNYDNDHHYSFGPATFLFGE